MGSVLEIEEPSGRREISLHDLSILADDGRVVVGDLIEEGARASHATFESRDGGYTASIPLDVVRRQGRVVLEGSGTLRLVVEEGSTLCWNVKDLGRIRLTVGKEPDSVPEDPPH